MFLQIHHPLQNYWVHRLGSTLITIGLWSSGIIASSWVDCLGKVPTPSLFPESAVIRFKRKCNAQSHPTTTSCCSVHKKIFFYCSYIGAYNQNEQPLLEVPRSKPNLYTNSNCYALITPSCSTESFHGFIWYCFYDFHIIIFLAIHVHLISVQYWSNWYLHKHLSFWFCQVSVGLPWKKIHCIWKWRKTPKYVQSYPTWR